MSTIRLLGYSIAAGAFLLFAVATSACSKKEESGDESAKAAKTGDSADKGEPSPAPGAEAKKASLPTETEAIPLDEGESEIPATITVPKGCTTFNDTPTTIRVDYGKMGELFGVQVKEGNEFNTNLKEFAGELRENKYGVTNEILEESDNFLLWTATSDGHTGHNFRLLVELGGKKWVCTQGNYGGWSREQVDRQVEACKTLAAKE